MVSFLLRSGTGSGRYLAIAIVALSEWRVPVTTNHNNCLLLLLFNHLTYILHNIYLTRLWLHYDYTTTTQPYELRKKIVLSSDDSPDKIHWMKEGSYTLRQHHFFSKKINERHFLSMFHS
jgi:hypothetical protein